MAEKKIYTIVRTDLMSGTTQATDLVSIQFQDGTGKPCEIENGSIVRVTNKLADIDDRETYVAVAPTADTPIEELALVAAPELMYDERQRNLNEFVNEAGAKIRGYFLRTNNRFSITREGFTGTGAVKEGQVVELTANSTKLTAKNSPTASTTKVGEVVLIETVENDIYYVIKIANVGK